MKNDKTTRGFFRGRNAGLVLMAACCFGLTAHAQDIRLPGKLGGLLRDLGAKNGINPNNSGANAGDAGVKPVFGADDPGAKPGVAGNQPVAAAAERGDDWADYHARDIGRAKESVDKFPKVNSYLVTEALEPWIGRAISARQRQEFMDKDNKRTPAQTDAINKALDDLAALITEKMAVYKPEDEKFAYGDGKEKELVKSQIPAEMAGRVIKIGLMNPSWVIATNNIGIPVYKTKAGFVWLKVKSDDHAFCRVLRIDIKQPYQGGGTYGPSYAKFDRQWLGGCA